MYAVFQSGGQQHKVSLNSRIKLQKLAVPVGEVVTFDQVLLLASTDRKRLGTPFVAGATVQAEVLAHGRGKKVQIIKFKRRKHSKKSQGHRQWFTEVAVRSIAGIEESSVHGT